MNPETNKFELLQLDIENQEEESRDLHRVIDLLYIVEDERNEARAEVERLKVEVEQLKSEIELRLAERNAAQDELAEARVAMGKGES